MQEILKNEQGMQDFAREFAKDVQAYSTILLSGGLGAGKTVFARALIQNLVGDDVDVPSPTFTLVQTYEGKTGLIYHFDLYRIEDPEEIYELGWEDAMADGIAIVEWPERLGEFLPETYTHIKIETMPDNQDGRIIKVTKEES